MRTHLTTALAIALPMLSQVRAAQPQQVLQDSAGISGFELYGKGALWWSAPGICEGELPREATVRVRMGNIIYGTRKLARACAILGTEESNAVRDDTYVYFFRDGQLHRKALSSAEAASSLSMPTPPYAPTLPSGQRSSVLELADGYLWFARYHAASGLVDVFKFKPDGSENAQYVTTILNGAPVKKLHWFRYRKPSGILSVPVEGLGILLSNGKLYRHELGGNNVLLARGVSDFTTHSVTSFGLSSTYVYAVTGQDGSLSPNTPPGRLLRIHPNTGASLTLYTAPGRNQLLSVATDSDQIGLGSRNIYFAEATVSCGGFFCTITDYAIRRNQLPGTDGTWDLIVNTGGGPNLRSDDQWVYFRRDNRIWRIATDAPAIQFDIAAVGLEVGQTMQDMSSGVSQLVAFKGPTYVRGYAYLKLNTSGQPTAFPTARLRAWVDGEEVPGSPFSPLNNTRLDRTNAWGVLRPALNRSYLFELSRADLPPGTLTLTMTVNPDGTMVETGPNPYANNSVSLPGPIALLDTVVPCLQMYAVPTGMGTFNPRTSPAFGSIIARARSLLPARNLWVSIEPWDWEGDVFFTQPFGGIKSDDDQDDEALDKIECISEQDGWLTGCKFHHFVGMIHPGVTNFGGLGNRPGVALIASMQGGANFSNPDAPLGGRTLAHEMGHNYNRKHVDCGGPKDPDGGYPFNPCTIGTGSATGLWGFDSLSQTVINPTNTGDLMSYAGSRWSSTYTWNNIFGAYLAAKLLAQADPAPAGAASVRSKSAPAQAMFVNGIVRADLSTAQFRDFFILPGDGVDPINLAEDLAASAELNSQEAYHIRQLTLDGALLRETAIPLRQTGDSDRKRFSFAHWIPFSPGTRRIQLVQRDRLLAERILSPNAPVLTLGAPIYDAATQTLSLEWTASDADGDPLLCSVHYSTDDGAHWQVLRNNYAGSSVVLAAQRLAGSTAARLRVWANDGVNTTHKITEPFTIPKKAPEPVVWGVRDGERVPFGQRLVLTGMAFDAEDVSGLIHLNWALTGPEPATGEGDRFVVGTPTPGLYAATLTALDTDDQAGATTVGFEVLPLQIAEGDLAPTLDGLCNDRVYGEATFLQIARHDGSVVPVRMVHVNDHFYVTFSELQLGGRLPTRIGLRVDVDASGEAAAQPDDIAFFVDDTGIPWQERGNGGRMQPVTDPALGFTAVVQRGSSTWCAEFRIADSLLDGWNHAARLMIDHGQVHWPATAEADSPATWAAAYFGASLPTPANRPPVAIVGGHRTVNLTRARWIALDGSASYDPDGDALTYAWKQVAGPSVTLSNAATANPVFVAEPVGERTELRFELLVHDGQAHSAPAEMRIDLVPTADLADTARASATREGNRLHLVLQGQRGWRYVIEATQDFSVWQAVSTNTANVHGWIEFIEPDITVFDKRFYRAKQEAQ